MSAEFWGGALVIAYSRADAIADGMLVDVTAAARAAGLTLHTAMTSAAHAALGCDDAARLARVLRAVRIAAAFAPPREDRVYLRLDGPDGAVEAWAHVGAGDTPAPVLTIMLDGED